MQEREAVRTDTLVLSVHQHLVEEKINFRPQASDRFQRRLVTCALDRRAHAVESSVEIRLRSRFEKRRIDSSTVREPGLLQNIANALEACRQRLEVFGGPHSRERRQARL